MNLFYYVLLSLASGAAVSIQGLMNAALRARLPLAAVILLNTFTGFVGAAVLFGILKLTSAGDRIELSGVPTPLLFAGLLGLLIIAAAAVAFPKIGATWSLTIMIFGQLAVALIADQQGWFGLSRIPIGWSRATGALLVLLGCWLSGR